MDSVPYLLRSAAEQDTAAMLAIYAPYVEKTAITFECDVPSPDAFARRISGIRKKYPCFVCVWGGEIVGFTYAGPFHSRAAYQWGAETTIYLKQEAKGKGMGRRLYAALEEGLKQMGILAAYACIAVTDRPDAHLDNNSFEFHRHMGYRKIADFKACGYKFDSWYDMIWMEKTLGRKDGAPSPIVPYPELIKKRS